MCHWRSAARSFLQMTATSSKDKPSSSQAIEENVIRCDAASNDESVSHENEKLSPVADSKENFESSEETTARQTGDMSNDDEEEINREKTKSIMARNLLYKSNLSTKSTSNTKKGRTHTSVGAIKGRSRSGRGNGTVGGNLLASVRKNAAVSTVIAEKGREEKRKNAAIDNEGVSEEKESSDPLYLSSATSNESLKTSIINSKLSEETNEGGLKANLSNHLKNGGPKSTGIFQSTINRILHNQEESRQREEMFANHPDKEKAVLDAGTKPTSKGIGLFGDSSGPQLPEPMRKPFPGTILTYPSCHFLNPSSSSFKKWKKAQASEPTSSLLESPEDQEGSTTPIQNAVTIRVATRLDDHQIANLRLSVFANYNSLQKTSSSSPPTAEQMKHLHNRFRLRSCQVLESRRNLGAICLIASVPKVFKNEFVAYSRNKQKGWRNLSSSKLSNKRMLEFWQSLKDWERDEEWITGSVECSIHEFYGTNLGKQRVKNGVLYITEVAVNPDARMIGVGNKLLQGVDKLAHIRNVETLYLHVDVTNEAAIGLYTKAGYKRVEPNPLHMSFTRSLNLHDGATNGRNHFLFYKHLRKPTILSKDIIWHDEDPDENPKPKKQLGFEMPR